MPDIDTRVTEAASPILDALMAALELRGADPQLRAMLTTYRTGAALPTGARVRRRLPRALRRRSVAGAEIAGVGARGGPSNRMRPQPRVRGDARTRLLLASWVDMGADALLASGRVDPGAAAELKAEARRRVASGEYFGHIAYLSLVARKSR
jgi:hypothetical protein